MADQSSQRFELAKQANTACAAFLNALHALSALNERRPFLGNFVEGDFAGSDLEYMDPATLGVLFDFVVPNLITNYNDVTNDGRNKQILNQVAKTL